jgi:hypothetical protein
MSHDTFTAETKLRLQAVEADMHYAAAEIKIRLRAIQANMRAAAAERDEAAEALAWCRAHGNPHKRARRVVATIHGRPAHEVVAERRREEAARHG